MLSVIVSVFDEAQNLRDFHARLLAATKGIPKELELLYVDDGSGDSSAAVLAELQRTDPRVVVVSLSRNFGHELAMLAGLDQCRGDSIVLLDADLQHPPELIPGLVSRIEAGDDIVFCVRAAYHASWWRRAAAHLFYQTINVVTNTEMLPDVTDFVAMNRKVADIVRRMQERDRFLRGLLRWSGFRQSLMHFEQPPRVAGESKYSFFTLFELALDAAISFSGNPLRKFAFVGLFISLSALAYGALVVFLFVFFRQVLLPGWATIVVSVMFLGGTTVFMLSVLGEYLARIYAEIKRRPLYLIKGVVRSGGGHG